MRYHEILESDLESVFDAELSDMLYDVSTAASRPNPNKKQVMQVVAKILRYVKTKGKNSYAFKTAIAHLKKMQIVFERTIPELSQLGDLSRFE